MKIRAKSELNFLVPCFCACVVFRAHTWTSRFPSSPHKIRLLMLLLVSRRTRRKMGNRFLLVTLELVLSSSSFRRLLHLEKYGEKGGKESASVQMLLGKASPWIFFKLLADQKKREGNVFRKRHLQTYTEREKETRNSSHLCSRHALSFFSSSSSSLSLSLSLSAKKERFLRFKSEWT